MLVGSICFTVLYVLTLFTEFSNAWNVTFLVNVAYSPLAYSYIYYAPAIDMAIEDINAKYGPEIFFSKTELSPKNFRTCSAQDANALHLVTDYLFENENGSSFWGDPAHLVVIVSNACSTSLQLLGDLAKDLNIPIIASGGSIAVLRDRERFPTMFHLAPYQEEDYCQTMFLFLQLHKWYNFYLLCDVNGILGNFFQLACDGYERVLLAAPKTTLTTIRFSTDKFPDYARYLRAASLRCRVILIVAHGNTTRDIMVTAKNLGMTNGDYVYVASYPMEHPFYGYFKWQFTDDKDDDAKEAFQSLYFVSTRPVRGPNYQPFEVEVKYRAYQRYDYMYESAETVSSFTALQHTIITLTAQIINESVAEAGQIRDGAKLMRKVLYERRHVSSVAGNFILDHADRELYTYVIVAMDHHTSLFKEVYEYNTVVKKLLPIPHTWINWFQRDSSPPDVPTCGFDGLDPVCDYSTSITVGTLLGLCAIVVLLGVPGYMIAKHLHANDDEMEDHRWYVPYADLEFSTAQNLVSQTGSSRIQLQQSYRSVYSIKARNSVTSTSTTNGQSRQNLSQPSKNVVRYKNKLIWAHVIALSHKFSPTMYHESLIKKMKHFNGQNIAHFYGLCPYEMNMIVLCEIGRRGSISDARNSESVKFDDSLKNSCISDLTDGMVYLHDSQIAYHGALSSRTCLLDSRFVLKVAYFRLDFLPRGSPDFVSDSGDPRHLFTCAPEQLRGPREQILHGSKEADVYAYGHVIAEIMCQMEPYEKEMDENHFTAKDVLEKICQNSIIPFRPKIPQQACSATFRQLIEKCWDDRMTSRPTFKFIEGLLKDVPGFKRNHNFVDSLFKRMTAYSEELEARIKVATAGMIEEKRKSEDLLFQVLPKHLATALTLGKQIEPEGFNSVTIGFTAIADFGTIASESTPIQIVSLLNDLYSMFDATLERFDVYKVETISDSYMIASGIPVRNGQEHSRQVANVSLELMKEAETFKMRHRPKDRLQLKIGFHQGTCAAGIVGMKMPRYCLFGDTINTASRMTSLGLALKIQVSTAAKEHLEQFKDFRFQYRGLIEIKGKGQQKCYWLLQAHDATEHVGEQESKPGVEVETKPEGIRAHWQHLANAVHTHA